MTKGQALLENETSEVIDYVQSNRFNILLKKTKPKICSKLQIKMVFFYSSLAGW